MVLIAPAASGIARERQGVGGSPAFEILVSLRAQPWAESAASRTHAPERSEGRRTSHRPRSGELDVGGPLVRAAVRIQKGHAKHTGLGGFESEAEQPVLADRLRGLELLYLLVAVPHAEAVEQVVVLVVRLAAPPLADLHRVDHQHASPDDVTGFEARGNAEPDASDVGHDQPPLPPTVTFPSRFAASKVP